MSDDWEEEIFEKHFEDELDREEAREYYRDMNAREAALPSAIEDANERGRPYVIQISPDFPNPTVYQSINAQCVKQNIGTTQGTLVGNTLVENIVQQLGGITVYGNVDVEIPGEIDHKSENLISIRLDTLEPRLRPNISGKVSVPLYQCLQREQMNNILYQYGLLGGLDDRNLVCVAHGRSANSNILDSVKNNPVEGIISEIAGRMLGGASMSRNWDLEQTYLCNIEYVITVSTKNVALEGTEGIHVGDRVNEDVYGKMPSESSSPEDTNNINSSDSVNKGKPHHAVKLKHTMVMTTHKVVSPRLRSCFDEVESMCGMPLTTIADVRKVTDNVKARSYLVELLTILFKEHENNIRVWRDARGEKDRLRQKTFAAYNLKKFYENGYSMK